MERIFENAISETNIKDDFLRELIHESLDGMFFYLDKENFMRWINSRSLSERIKKLVVDEYDDYDKKNNPNSIGLHFRGQNLIKLLQKNKSVATHELYHFFIDLSKHFSKFLNEGLTEYLNMLTNNDYRYSYKENVEFVQLLHNAVGDSLIKAYLMGVDDDFLESFRTYFEGWGEDENKLSYEDKLRSYEDFVEISTEMHKYLHGTDEEKKKIENPEELRKRLAEYYKVIVENTIEKRAKDLKYYDDGKLDINEAIKDIKNITFFYKRAIDTLYSNKVDKPMIDENFYRKCFEKVIYNSHLLEEYDDPDERADKIVNSILNEMRDGDGKIRSLKTCFEFDEITKKDNVDVPYKLASALRWNLFKAGEFDITDFLMMCMSVKYKTNATKFQIETLIRAGLVSKVEENCDLSSLCIEMDDISNVLANLQKKKSYDERNTIDTKFVKLEEGVFIEKKDSHLYYLEIDKETGEMNERPLHLVATTGCISDYLREDLKSYDYNTKLFRLKSKNENDTFKIAIDENFDNICIYKGNKKQKSEVLDRIKDLAEDYMINEVLEAFIIFDEKYVSKDNDAENPYDILGVMYSADIDERSRKINFEGYLEELKSKISAFSIPCQEKALTIVLESLLNQTFGTVSEDIYKEVYNLSKDYLLEAADLSEKLDILNKLSDCTDKMNEERKTKVKENKKTVLVKFRNATAKERYESAKQVRKIEQEKKVATNFLINSIDECVEEKADYSTSDFPGALVVGNYKQRKANTINFSKYIDTLKHALEDIDEENRENFINTNVMKSLEILYGEINEHVICLAMNPNKNKSESERQLDIMNGSRERRRKFIYTNMNKKIAELLLNNLEVSSEFIENMNMLQEKLNNINKQLDKDASEKSLITFKNPQIEDLYKRAKEIEKSSDIPAETKKMVIDSLKSAANALNMADMAKSALQGPNMATSASVTAYDKNMSTDKKVGVDKND